MEFIGRQQELDVLETQYRREHSFVIVSGRRRVGKSTLIMRFLEGKEHLYYEVAETSKQMILPDFSKRVGESIGIPGVLFPDWESAMGMYIRSRPGRKVIVIDEFQYLMTADDGILHRFQSLWDNMLSKEDVMLILCGSYLTMMGKVTKDYNSPLYGRNTADLRVQPFRFPDTVSTMPYREAVECYAVTGGVPFYMELMDPGVSAAENAKRLTMSLGGALVNEPGYLFSGEFRNLGNYNTYLRIMSEGNSKMQDIIDNAHSDQGSISPYITKLMEISVISRETPVTSKPNSKSSLYRISDNFIALWFRFVFPDYYDIMRGRGDHAKSELDKHFIDWHVSRVFEDVSLDALMDVLRENGISARYGRYWDKDNEMDIAALDSDHRTIYVGECKYWSKPVDRHVLLRLMAKCENTEAFRNLEVRPCVFSASGFTQDAIDIAREEDAVLFDCGRPPEGDQAQRSLPGEAPMI